MSVCGVCGRPRSGNNRFCTGCGAEFSERPQAPAASPVPAAPAAPAPAPRRRPGTALYAGALALVVIGGGAYGLTAAFSGHGTDSARSVADQGTQAAVSPPASATSGGGQPSASPLPSTQAPTPTASSPGTAVTVAAAAATDPAEPGVVALLGTYFAAINQHDYTEYQSVLDQQLQQGDSRSTFQSGYGTTTDSAETLTGISDTGSGQVAASVTFVSHQDPADSPSDSSCTDWGITLYLVSSGDGYVIGSPPSGYHASYQSC